MKKNQNKKKLNRELPSTKIGQDRTEKWEWGVSKKKENKNQSMDIVGETLWSMEN